jgi:hypothetical protein
MEPRISFVTLGVSDLARSLRFYTEVLGLQRRNDDAEVAFFEMGRTWLALYPRHLLAADAGVADDAAPGGGFSGFALAHNVRTPEEVDALLAEVAGGGGEIVKPAREADWGGRSGYFADPDGFLWEVAWNPRFPHV